ncbi:MAG: efflux RND transporter periplasmic adaptor subunit [Patescibacteria group bacterium]
MFNKTRAKVLRHKIPVFTVLVLLVASIATVAVSASGGRLPGQMHTTSNQTSNGEAQEVQGQEYGLIRKKKFTKKGQYTGSVGAEKETLLAAKTSGRISVLNYQVGDEVGNGYLVAQLSGEELHAQLSMAGNSLDSAEKQYDATGNLMSSQVSASEAQVNTSTAGLDVVKAQRESYHATSAKQLESAQKSVEAARAAYDIASEQEKEVYKAQYEKAQKEYELLQESVNAQKKSLDTQVIVAERQLDQAKQGKTTAEENRNQSLETIAGQRQYAADNVALAQIAVNNTKVVAPYYGVIVAKHAEVGDIVGAGQPVVTIANNVFIIKISVPETEISKVSVDQRADVRFDSIDGTFLASVSRIYPSIDPATRTFTVELTLTTQPNALKYGQTVRISLYQESSESYFVHRDFVTPSYDGPYITFENGRKTFVTTGVEDGNEIEIGYPGIVDGQKIVKGDTSER